MQPMRFQQYLILCKIFFIINLYNEIEANTAQSDFSLTNLHNLIDFSHLPFSQKSSKIFG